MFQSSSSWRYSPLLGDPDVHFPDVFWTDTAFEHKTDCCEGVYTYLWGSHSHNSSISLRHQDQKWRRYSLWGSLHRSWLQMLLLQELMTKTHQKSCQSSYFCFWFVGGFFFFRLVRKRNNKNYSFYIFLNKWNHAMNWRWPWRSGKTCKKLYWHIK